MKIVLSSLGLFRLHNAQVHIIGALLSLVLDGICLHLLLLRDALHNESSPNEVL